MIIGIMIASVIVLMIAYSVLFATYLLITNDTALAERTMDRYVDVLEIAIPIYIGIFLASRVFWYVKKKMKIYIDGKNGSRQA